MSLKKSPRGTVKEEVERLISEIEEHIKGLIFAPAQTFPVTQTFDADGERVTVIFHEPDNEGNISCEIVREVKTVEISFRFDES